MTAAKNDYFPTQKELLLVERYPDDDLALKIIFGHIYGAEPKCPRCEKQTRFYPVYARRTFVCGGCRYHVSPLKGTIFEKTPLALADWFKVIKLVVTSSGGVPALEIQRLVGTTYKTAWRMKDKICQYLAMDKTVSYEFSSKMPSGRPRNPHPR
jgi:transposase-like protein